MKKIIITLFAVGVLGGTYGFCFFNKSGVVACNKDASGAITATELVKEFNKDENTTNSKYLNKEILVSGIVKYSNTVNESQNIILETGDVLSSISCEMTKSTDLLESGDEVLIKGEYRGYLLDVVLTKCVIQN